MQSYNAKIHCRPGKDVQLADTLSGADLKDPRVDKENEFEMVNMAKHIPISQPLMRQIEDDTRRDGIVQQLKLMIQT